jgi:rod shape-determining protein MreD
MTTDLLKRFLWFFLFILAQVFVLGRIHLFHYATPLFYVYFVVLFPRNHPKWAVLIWSFMLGLLIDCFTNTPGLASSSLTLIAALQPYVLELFAPRDSDENFVPSVKELGPVKYSLYVFILVFLFCVVFYTLEILSFSNWLQWVFCVTGSMLLTLLLIATFEYARSK